MSRLLKDNLISNEEELQHQAAENNHSRTEKKRNITHYVVIIFICFTAISILFLFSITLGHLVSPKCLPDADWNAIYKINAGLLSMIIGGILRDKIKEYL